MHPLCSTELLISCKWSVEEEIVHLIRLINNHIYQYTVSSFMNFCTRMHKIVFFNKRVAFFFFFFKRFYIFSTIKTLKSTPQSKNVPMLITQPGLYKFYSVLVCCFKHFLHLYIFFFCLSSPHFS